MKKIFTIAVTALLTGLSGCANFLDEESYGSTTDLFNEENGIKALVYQSYTKINNIYGGGSDLFMMTDCSADLVMRAQANDDSSMCDYNGLDANSAKTSWMWNHCYKALANINMFFETIDTTPFADPGEKGQCKAEMYVMRALFLWIVTEMWGDTYLPMTTDETEGSEARRSTRAEFYKEIIGCLRKATELLPDKRTDEIGRIDMPTAKALLARMYLYNEQWDEAAAMASEVIDHYGLALSPTLKGLWADDKPNNEFIWPTEWTEDSAFNAGVTNWHFQFYSMNIGQFSDLIVPELGYTGFDNGGWGLPTPYYISLFDHKADRRWSDLHQNVWLCNKEVAQSVRNEYPLNQMRRHVDTMIYISVDPLTEAERKRMKQTYRLYELSDLYNTQGVPRVRNLFIGITKFDDHTRTSALSGLSDRPYPVIRLGELYLIRAEARIRSTANRDLEGAAGDITELRKRAVNDTRPEYVEAMKVTAADMTPEFILAERARELCGEWQRWLDLKRYDRADAGFDMIAHIRRNNPDAAGHIQDYHRLRPIPQIQFDGMPDWRTLGQNPGY